MAGRIKLNPKEWLLLGSGTFLALAGVLAGGDTAFRIAFITVSWLCFVVLCFLYAGRPLARTLTGLAFTVPFLLVIVSTCRQQAAPLPPTPSYACGALRNRSRTTLLPPRDSMIYNDTPSVPVLSPDGTYVAAVVSRRSGGSRIMVRPSTGASDWRECVDQPESGPWWSPDGKGLFFIATARDGTRAVMETDVSCGHPTRHASIPPHAPFAGASANAAGYLLVSLGRVLYYGHKANTALAILLRPQSTLGEWALTNPQFDVNGDSFLYTALGTRKQDDAVYESSVSRLQAAPLHNPPVRFLLRAETHAEFGTPTCLIAGRRGDLLAHAYYPPGHESSSKPPESLGLPSALGTFVGRNQNLRGAFSVANGRLAYYHEVSTANLLAEFSPCEREPYITLDTSVGTQNPQVSPDGSSIIVAQRDFAGQDRTLYKISRLSRERTVLTRAGTGDNANPVWSPSGAILFSSDRTRPRSLYLLKPGARIGGEERMGAPAGSTGVTPTSWADDSRLLVQGNIGPRYGLFVLDSPFATTYSLAIPDAWAGQFSPLGGRWIAYQAWKGDHMEVFVIKADGSTTVPLKVSRDRGYQPRWAPDGRIFFMTDTGSSGGSRLLMAAAFDERSGQVGEPKPCRDYRLAGPANIGNYTFLPNGNLLMLYNEQDPQPPYHEVVDLW